MVAEMGRYLKADDKPGDPVAGLCYLPPLVTASAQLKSGGSEIAK